MIDPIRPGKSLVCERDGIWRSASCADVSFPSDGYNRCLEIEASSFWFAHRNDCIVEAMRRFPPSGPILDIGGGNGYVSLGIKQAGFGVALLEPGYDGAMNAKARGIDMVICSTLDDAGFEEGSLYAAGLFDVLEHIEQDGAFLGTIHRLLQQDGRLYITVPAYRWLWSVEDACAGHYRRYTAGTISKLLEQHGFKVEYSTYFFTLLPVPIFLLRALPGALGLRKTSTLAANKREHTVKGQFGAQLMRRYLDSELCLIRKGRIPFGASCLIVVKPI